MKKTLTLIALAILALGCKKFNTDKDSTLIISFPQSTYEMEVGDVVGFHINRNPSSGKEPKYNFSNTNSSVAVVNGSNIVAKAEGTTTIRASVKDDEKVYCECTVNVSPKINAVQITSMSLTTTVLDIADLAPDGDADWQAVGVTLQPSEAGWDDVNIYSDDSDVYVETLPGDPLQLKVYVTPNPEHNDTDCRSVLLHLKALKGNVEETIHVNVCGHVRGLSVPRLESNDHFVSNKTVRYARGLTFSTGAQLEYTGNNFPSRFMADLVKFSSDNVELLTVDKAGKFSIPAGAAVTGNSNPCHVTVSVGFGVPDVRFPVYTYEKPTSYSYDIHKDDNHLLVGSNYILSITATPENSLCWISVPTPPSEISDVEVTNMDNNKAKITFKVEESSAGEIKISPDAPIFKIGPWAFYADDYLETQPKIGDFVYYDDSGKKFGWADGGLRALTSSGTARYADGGTRTPVDGKGTLIGVIYDDYEPTSSVTDRIRLVGFSGKHFKICCKKDASVGEGENGTSGRYSYTKASCNVADRWRFESVYLPTANQENTVLANLGIVDYNNGISDSDYSYRIRAHYPVEALQENGSDRLPVKVGTSSVAGSTGWMLPLKKDAEMILERKSIITHANTFMGNISGPYWTASYNNDNTAWAFGNNSTMSGVNSIQRSSVLTTRAILIL